MKRFFTSESVTEGHPDKICDQISDAILDSILEKDPYARVACETTVSTGLVLVMGEISTNCYIDIPKVVRETIRDIGYTRAKYGFDADTCSVLTSINEQSSDIALGVNKALEAKLGIDCDEYSIGAGDQGMMFGYATNETENYMPMPIYFAHKLAKRLSILRKENILTYLRPDGKTQVTVEYEENMPVRIEAIVISTQHAPEVTSEEIKTDMIEHLIKPIIPSYLIDKNTKFFINPTGRFVIGGPKADTGLTGRKIIVDTYGGYGRHGGGAFSGKDPTKVDRSAAYMARYVAKNLVAAGVADKLELEIAYAIGVASPVSIAVETFDTGKLSDDEILKIIDTLFDLRPASIIDKLNLRKPIYKDLAAYGHFGRDDLNLSFEKLDSVDEIKYYIKTMFGMVA